MHLHANICMSISKSASVSTRTRRFSGSDNTCQLCLNVHAYTSARPRAKSSRPFAPMLTCSPPATHTTTRMPHTPSSHTPTYTYSPHTAPYSQPVKRRETLEHARRQRRDLIASETPGQAQAGWEVCGACLTRGRSATQVCVLHASWPCIVCMMANVCVFFKDENVYDHVGFPCVSLNYPWFTRPKWL